ncbi:MAG: toll/interleukin-1 receptor domain-containing protein [Chloroflexi bacterium]|nr:toll/interleukin-1 receptor domain-containing protein [Chloroflexota bacterium]
MNAELPQVFLAHSSEDHVKVGRLAYDLRRRGIPVWYDEWELRVGDSLHDKIEHGIRSSGYLMVVLSPHSVESPWVKKELNAALSMELEKRQLFVIPALIAECEAPLFLKDKMYADFRSDYAKGLDQVLARLLPEGTVSTMLKNVDSLELHLLPAFTNGELVQEYDLNRIMQAINSVEHRIGLDLTRFRLMKKGQIVAASHINQLLAPIDRIRLNLGLAVKWQHHPIAPLQMYTSAHLNEIYGSVNEAIRRLVSS